MSVLAYMGYYYYDVTYLLVILGAVLSMIASAQVNSTFKRYSRVRSSCGMTGAEAAERILYRNGLTNVRIEHISGNLTDHYDPSSKVLRLSDATYNATSVAAVGVAAHECGHAVQDARGYAPLKFRILLKIPSPCDLHRIQPEASRSGTAPLPKRPRYQSASAAR